MGHPSVEIGVRVGAAIEQQFGDVAAAEGSGEPERFAGALGGFFELVPEEGGMLFLICAKIEQQAHRGDLAMADGRD